MTASELEAVAQHPTVQQYFNWLGCWQFARFYCTLQSRSETLLSLIDTIERWRCAPIAELVKEMRA